MNDNARKEKIYLRTKKDFVTFIKDNAKKRYKSYEMGKKTDSLFVKVELKTGEHIEIFYNDTPDSEYKQEINYILY